MDIFEWVVLPVISLIVLFFLTKMMGYRQITQMSMYDYIVGITIGSIASELIMSDFSHFLKPLMGMIICAILTVLLSKGTNISIALRHFVQGQPIVLYENHCIYNQELIQAKMDIEEFLMQCRINGYFELEQLDTVILETNGTLSFLPKEKYRPFQLNDYTQHIEDKKNPLLLVKEGRIYNEQLVQIHKDYQWLQGQLKVHNIQLDDVILMYYLDNGKIDIYTTNKKKRNFIS